MDVCSVRAEPTEPQKGKMCLLGLYCTLPSNKMANSTLSLDSL